MTSEEILEHVEAELRDMRMAFSQAQEMCVRQSKDGTNKNMRIEAMAKASAYLICARRVQQILDGYWGRK